MDRSKAISTLVIEAPYLLELIIRRFTERHPREAKTDDRDALIIANTTRTRHHTLRGITAAEKDIRELALLCGFADDLTVQMGTQRAEIETGILTLVETHPLTRPLTSIPGIRVRTAARILTEVVGKHFATNGYMACPARIVPVNKRSGTSTHGELPSRHGDKDPQRSPCLSAFASLNATPYYRANYCRKLGGAICHDRDDIALTRRRTDILHTMPRHGVFCHDPDRLAV